MNNKLSDFALALGVSFFIVAALYSVQELTGIRAVEIFGIGVTIGCVYRWIRSWDE